MLLCCHAAVVATPVVLLHVRMYVRMYACHCYTTELLLFSSMQRLRDECIATHGE
jgi:hypothetical protein